MQARRAPLRMVGRLSFPRAEKSSGPWTEARAEGQAAGWGQAHQGAYRALGDGCEETAEAERCKPGAPLYTWANDEEVRSLSSSRGPRKSRVKVRGAWAR
jgi:hypothetical protein